MSVKYLQFCVIYFVTLVSFLDQCRVCVCVCVCVCVRACVHMRACMYVYMQICMY